MSLSLIEKQGDFELDNFAENFVKAYLDPTRYVIMAGIDTEVTKQLIIPYAHRLVKIVLRHTDSANADLVGELNYYDFQIRRDVGFITAVPLGKEIVKTETKIPNTLITVPLGENYEYEPTAYTLGFYGTSTDRIHVIVYLQRIGRRRGET
jgi:hypothetical protein